MNNRRFNSRDRWGASLLLAAVLAMLDQLVKAGVAATLPLGSSVTLTPWFNLVHVLNPGAAFSFLADAGGWQRHALSGIGIVVSLALAVMLWRGVRSRLEAAAYVGLIGGALGNVADPLPIGAVVDNLDLHWRDKHWPAGRCVGGRRCRPAGAGIVQTRRCPRAAWPGRYILRCASTPLKVIDNDSAQCC